jgi:Protein of unknown function (DUF3987)
MSETATEAIEKEIVEIEESLPEFPKLPGALGEFIEALTDDLPYAHKALCAAVYLSLKISGRVRLASEPNLQTRFYGIMISGPGTGKSAADKETRRALAPLLEEDIATELSIDSGPALVEALSENRRVLYAPDEMADAFEKAKLTNVSRNSLFGEFLKLFEGTETGRRVVKKNAEPILLSDVHFAMIGGATPDRFEKMWGGTGGSASGLQTRFILSASNQTMPALKTPNNDAALAAALEKLTAALGTEKATIKLSSEAQDSILGWSLGADQSQATRALDMGKRMALLLAACNRAQEINAETMETGLDFATYQIELYSHFMPKDSSGHVQAFENRILSAIGRHGRLTARDLRNLIHPDRHPGGYGAFLQALKNLIGAGAIISRNKTRKGAPIFERD